MRLTEVAALGARMRWQMVTNRLRRRGRRTHRWTIVFAVGYALVNIAGLATARLLDEADASDTLILFASSMALGWIFGPILMGGVDETIDPTRLALLPMRPSERFVLQFAAAMSGAGPLAAVIGLTLGLLIGHTGIGLSLVVAPLGGMLTVLLAVGMARAVAALLTLAQRSRTGRDFAILLASLIAGALFVMAQLAGNFDDAAGARIIDILQWAPWAWPARAVNAARVGDEAAALSWLVVAAATAAAALWCWARLSLILLTSGERAVRSGARWDRPLLNSTDSVFGASMSRQWIYLRRSPNTRVGFLFGLAFGVAFALVQVIQQGSADHPAAPYGILLAMVANLGATTNVLGFDAGSLWLEVLCGGPRRPHMVARSAIALPNLLLPTWLAGVVIGSWTGQWRMVAVVSLLAVPVAVFVLAFGLVASVLAPWPLPDGDNPFGNRQADGRGPRLILVAMSGLFTVAMLSAPMLVVSYVTRDSGWVWLVPFGGLGFALVVGAVVVWWVGRRLRGREPDLVELLSPLAYTS